MTLNNLKFAKLYLSKFKALKLSILVLKLTCNWRKERLVENIGYYVASRDSGILTCHRLINFSIFFHSQFLTILSKKIGW